MLRSRMMVVHFCLYLCFMVYFAAGSGDISICSYKQQVTAKVGDPVLLSCHFSDGGTTKNLTVIWTKPTEAAVVYNQSKHEAFNHQSAAFSSMYKDWVQEKAATLGVEKIRAEDAGEYSCWIIQSPPSPLTTYKCCTIRLHVLQQWKGDEVQVVVAWSIYVIFLSLCLFLLHSCRQQRSPPDKLYEI